MTNLKVQRTAFVGTTIALRSCPEVTLNVLLQFNFFNYYIMYNIPYHVVLPRCSEFVSRSPRCLFWSLRLSPCCTLISRTVVSMMQLKHGLNVMAMIVQYLRSQTLWIQQYPGSDARYHNIVLSFPSPDIPTCIISFLSDKTIFSKRFYYDQTLKTQLQKKITKMRFVKQGTKF